MRPCESHVDARLIDPEHRARQVGDESVFEHVFDIRAICPHRQAEVVFMAEVILVTDPLDDRLTSYGRLNDPVARERHEKAAGVFVVEGMTAIGRLLDSDHTVLSLLLTESRYERMAERLADVDVPVFVATRDILRATVGFDLHRGAVALARRPALPSLDDVLANAQTVLVLEGLNDHENLGTIARTARALGVDALVLDPSCADPFYRRSIRVSMGEMLFLSITVVADWPADLARIRTAGFRLLALTPAADAVPLRSLWRAPGERLALMLGAEGPGLTPAAQQAADQRVRIEISTHVDSVNVGHAAAIALHALAATSV
jgi:tRNA G18 (ribose-2'-O)-methylase SpoU